MGMFDYYWPRPDIRCPACGIPLHGWQGKDAACALFLWAQGAEAPIDQVVDDECKISVDKRVLQRLPERFEIYTSCDGCKRWTDATGFLANGVWSATVVGSHGSSSAVRAVSLGGDWRQCSACAYAWEDGSGNALSRCPSCNVLTTLDGRADAI